MMPFTRDFTAEADDIDELGHVNNAVWVRWIQDVALAHWYAVARPDHRARYVWVVVRHEIDYPRALGPGGTVTAGTWVGAATRGARFDRYVSFTDAVGKVYVRAETTWAILDKATGRAIRIPAEVVAPFMSSSVPPD